jgi:hypothetical protein
MSDFHVIELRRLRPTFLAVDPKAKSITIVEGKPGSERNLAFIYEAELEAARALLSVPLDDAVGSA